MTDTWGTPLCATGCGKGTRRPSGICSACADACPHAERRVIRGIRADGETFLRIECIRCGHCLGHAARRATPGWERLPVLVDHRVGYDHRYDGVRE